MASKSNENGVQNESEIRAKMHFGVHKMCGKFLLNLVETTNAINAENLPPWSILATLGLIVCMCAKLLTPADAPANSSEHQQK